MRMGDYNSPMSDVNHDRYEDAYLRKILRETKTIAMVGASANWNRPSYFAMKYLLDRGYRIIPVNPAAAGQEIMGQKVYGSLDELPVKADMVDIFRNSEAAGPITDEAIRHGAKVVWMQLGVRNEEAARRAEAAGLKVVMNRCPKIEHSRLTGSIEWHGIASGVIDVLEHEGGGLIDRRRARAGGRVGLRAGVDGKRREARSAFGHGRSSWVKGRTMSPRVNRSGLGV